MKSISQPKNRSALYKTLLALEHHAKHLKEIVSYVTAFALAGNYDARSSRGGANSWELIHPDGRVFILRARRDHISVTHNMGHGHRQGWKWNTRLDVKNWFETI